MAALAATAGSSGTAVVEGTAAATKLAEVYVTYGNDNNNSKKQLDNRVC